MDFDIINYCPDMQSSDKGEKNRVTMELYNRYL